MLTKGSQLAFELYQSNKPLTWAALVVGIVAGTLKVLYLFNFFCRRNIDRIDALESPRLWQFFRPQFFLALAAMIMAGAALSKLALESFPMLVFVVALDFSLATALLGSAPEFLRKRNATV